MSDQDWVDDPVVGSEGDWQDDDDGHFTGEGLLRGTLKALPAAGGLFGGALGFASPLPGGTVVGAGLGSAGGKALQNFGEKLLGDEKSYKQAALDPVVAGLEGAAAEMGGQVLGKGIEFASPYVAKGADSAGQGLKKVAGKFAKNATGATGAQSAKFADDAGEQLLDRGLIKFGDNAENIAKRTSDAVDSASSTIDGSLKALDAKGVTASADNVVKTIENRISELQKDPSQAGIVRKLRSIVDDIIQTGESNIPISRAETTKRGFNKMAGNWMDPEAGQAGKQAYLSYMDEVERAAAAADPGIAQQFKSAKESYGLLRPIQEAAERRSATLNQSPLGGLLDTATAGGAGATVGGLPGMVAGAGAAVGRRIVAPRVSSSVAVTLDKVAKSLMKSPQMAKLAEESPTAFKGMVQMLGNKISNVEQAAPMSLPRAAEKQQGDGAMNFQDTGGKEALLQKTQGTKYGQVLKNAADNGDQSLSAAHYVLAQRDPEYRKVIEGN